MASKTTRSPKQTADSAVTVVLHRLGATWHALAAHRANSGGGLRITATQSLPLADRSTLNRWVGERAPGRVLVVVPASRIICRSFSLPESTPDRLEAALQLQAEAHLLGAVPPHRLGLALLPGGDGQRESRADRAATRTGLLVGWPEAPGTEVGSQAVSTIERPLDPSPAVPEASYVADVAGLAGLLDGYRPAEPVLWLDRSEGAVALAVSLAGASGFDSADPAAAADSAGHSGTPRGVVFRATREEFADEAEWRRDVVRVVSETLLTAGSSTVAVRDAASSLTAQLEKAGAAALLAPAALRERAASLIEGTERDASWWDRFGIAVGVLLCLDGDLEPLTRMQADRTEVRPTPVARVAAALSRPRTAAALAILGLVLVAFGPLALSRLRTAVLQLKAPDQASLRKQNLEDSKRRAMYGEMGRQTWPMSKLLADLANSTPTGVSLHSLVIDHGSGLRLEGTASPKDGKTGVDRLVAMTHTMNETGVFALADFDREPGPSHEAVEFTVTASVADPFRDYQWAPEQDFNVKSLAVLEHGKETTPGVEVPPDKDDRGASASGAGSTPSASPIATAAPAAGAAMDETGDATPARGRDEVAGTAPDASGRAGELAAGPRRASAAGGPARRGARGEPAADPEANPPTEGDGSEESKAGDAPAGDGSAVADGGQGAEGAGRVRPDRRPLGRRGDAEGRAAGAASRSEQPPPAAGGTVTDPISDAAIAAMSRGEAQDMLAKVAKARQLPDLDDETKARLKAEFDKLLARTRGGDK